MRFIVDWLPTADGKLVDYWANSLNRKQITDTANRIDDLLARDPLGVGEPYYGTMRVLIEAPLAVYYDVHESEHRVYVVTVRLIPGPTD